MTTTVWFRSHVERQLQEGARDRHQMETGSDDACPVGVGTAEAPVHGEAGTTEAHGRDAA